MLDFSVTFIITIINIAILFFLLRAILWKPVTKFMADRAKRIEESLEYSEKDKAQAKVLLAQYKAQLKTAETEAMAILNSAKEDARQEAEKIIADSRITAEEILVNARKQLKTEHESAMSAFRKEAASLVVAAAGQILAREIKSEDSKVYADMLLNEVSPQKEEN